MAVSPEVIRGARDNARHFRSPFGGRDSAWENAHAMSLPTGEVAEGLWGEHSLSTELLYHPTLDVVAKIYAAALPHILVPNPRTSHPEQGIYTWQILASGETGQKSNEFYTTPFGRDLAITLMGLVEAVEHGAHEMEESVIKGISALEELESYQATADDPKRGVKKGQIPHELRFATDPRFTVFEESNWPMTTRVNETGEVEKVMINYDSSEATQLYVLLCMKLEQLYPGFAHKRQRMIDEACTYMLRNSFEHRGLAGFTNDLPGEVLKARAEAYADLSHTLDQAYPNHQRATAGLEWREIRDSAKHSYENGLLPKPGEPIDGLQTTAIKFAAELEAADYYERIGEVDFSRILREDAALTKKKTNSTEGFLHHDRSGVHFVEAVGVNPASNKREQLPYVTASPLYALAFSYVKKDHGGMPLRDTTGRIMRESVIDDIYLDAVVARLMTELLDEESGLATYSSNQVIPSPRGESHDGYWIHIPEKKTFWGPEQNLAAKGLIDFGFTNEGLRVGVGGSSVIEQFGTPLENWVKHEDGRITRWELPGDQNEVVQASGHIQAFTTGPGIAFVAQVNELRAKQAQSHLPKRQLVGQALYLSV